jgi:hypothetical protein
MQEKGRGTAVLRGPQGRARETGRTRDVDQRRTMIRLPAASSRVSIRGSRTSGNLNPGLMYLERASRWEKSLAIVAGLRT